MANHSASTAPEPCIIVIFGASGDLTHRKLIPSLYDLDRQGMLPGKTAILGVARTPMTDAGFRDKLQPSAKEFSHHFDAGAWAKFAPRVCYQPLDATDEKAFSTLVDRIQQVGDQFKLNKSMGTPNILFYLSVSPDLYEPIIANIGVSGLVTEGKRWCAINPQEVPWQRVIVEKPFGTDLATAQSLNRSLGRVFEEEAIFRIDHYLGKELVQNILVMRFANTIFEPFWHRGVVDHVQVTAVEKVGVGSRAGTFYDKAGGAMRDMIQSHLLQVLALVAMEPPSAYDSAAIMREKIKLFNCARPVPDADIPRYAVFGRYGAGDKGEPAYASEKGVEPDRRTETYASMRLDIDNWRWAGVPFFLRSGKKMAEKLTEVVVQFKRPPTNIFRTINPSMEERPANRMIINIAPREGISLRIEGKVPGAGLKMDSAKFDLDYIERFGGEPIEAYGPLILDAMRGDRTLYKHRDEVESGWRICDPFLHHEGLRKSIETYMPGSWGPAGADQMLAADGRTWHNPSGNDVR